MVCAICGFLLHDGDGLTIRNNKIVHGSCDNRRQQLVAKVATVVDGLNADAARVVFDALREGETEFGRMINEYAIWYADECDDRKWPDVDTNPNI